MQAKHKKQFPIASVPIIIWMTLLVGCPLIFVFVLSFLSRDYFGNIEFTFTFENYLRIFDPLYINIFITSIFIALTTALITLLIGYPFAYFTARLKRKTRNLILMLVMIPFWTSSLLRTFGFITLLRNDGIINRILISLNIIQTPITFLYNHTVVMAGTVYMLLPFMILPIYNSVEKLDNSLLEASTDLGAGRFRTFINITLPLTLPGIIGGVTLVFIPAVGLFFISDLLGGSKTMLLGNLIQSQFQSARDWPFGAALSVIMMVGVLLCLVFYNLASKRSGQSGGDLF